MKYNYIHVKDIHLEDCYIHSFNSADHMTLELIP